LNFIKYRIWSRSVCINDSLEKGSVIPFLEFAKINDYNVLIFNPNERYSSTDSLQCQKKINEFSSMEKHCLWVWENIIEKFSKTDEIHIIAHSMGGACTVEILKNANKFKKINLIKKIVFTDSVHGESLKKILLTQKQLFKDLIKVNKLKNIFYFSLFLNF